LRLVLLAALLASPAGAQDGRVVFENHCASCHAVVAGAPPMAGPNLHGLMGRRVAGDAAFGYSNVLQKAGRQGDHWDAERLDRFLGDPEAMYPGLWMGGNGLHAGADRQAVADFLREAR
jgi:cytochrome c